jgi:hypothetical protein
VAVWSSGDSVLGQRGRARALGEGEGGSGGRERKDRRIDYFSYLRLNGCGPLYL